MKIIVKKTILVEMDESDAKALLRILEGDRNSDVWDEPDACHSLVVLCKELKNAVWPGSTTRW